ncbi:glycosyltransferase family 4 protein [Neobacillus rhizophilus]|uniref:Undecaprenyl/decaprenyl-phosphate alpha-N-acetylglucosaminyl 1-phosphate transferase n=1 Tax=Neobacillus rhizophilus TaxID=2833579 RepID=A0A942U5M8_9BACI|nr:MraY family glycosyltransferase [Neobacillus rhizophilus]MBS4213128.1 undecaprenyl/decaprenyl-phosphate alpha-N-acetylglucosaminyl 1-phosphate transferase [Neobacillus rhizophilus]MBU8914749.1 undecaprenyl/decaprenyl-phosphate alpha-N-acetylglucosaminyl 1-phosphate transferase [Bacillus sp. FJAT-29953]
MLLLTMILCFVASVLITPLVKKLAILIGATDRPNQRKVHQSIMPRLGGLAIFISFMLGIFLLRPANPSLVPILIGCLIIIVTGLLDDLLELSAKYKLLGQLAAAVVVVFWGNLQVVFINLPFGAQLQFGLLSIPFTIIWIVGITNSINLIDGLDGLAAGVSSIALITISGMAVIQGHIFVAIVGLIVLASTLGFLIYNFHPASIFMGDTGALFLGYIISVLSLMGFKNVTFISFIIPVIVLAVPISDTFFAILRRIIHKKPLGAPDKQHLHHCMLRMGYSHRQAVLLIYAMSAFFGLMAVIYSQARIGGALFLILLIILFIEITAEKIGLVGRDYRPILNILQTLRAGSAKGRS